MSRFDFLLNKRSFIYTNCVQAEQATDISVQMLKIRQVLEYIIQNVLSNYDYEDNRDLFAGINLLNDKEVLDEHLTKLFHRTRITTNQNIHASELCSGQSADTNTAMTDLVEIVIWHERNHGRDGFDQSGFMTQDLPLARRYLGSRGISDVAYIDVNVDPLQIMGSFDIDDEPINVLEQDVFETQEEYEARIADMEPVHIGYGILDTTQDDGYTNIRFLRHHLDRNQLIRFVQAPVYFFTTEAVVDTVIDGELVAKLLVHDHQVYLDYSQVFLRSGSVDLPVSFICWDKTDYESAREHQARIASLPILPLALCKPVRREYDIDKQTLPFRVQQFAYVKTTFPSSIIVPCPRDLAKRICANNRPCTIFGKIPCDDSPIEYSIWNVEEGIIYNNREAIEQAKREQEEKERERRAKEEAERKAREEQARREKEAEQEITRQYEQGKQYWADGKYELAIKCYQFAAERGHAWAKRKLKEAEQNPVVQCEIGDGLWKKENYTEAVKWYRKATEQGYAEAQNNLGYCYQHGYGVTKNYEEAVKWYRLAAEQGNADAQYSLGYCYYWGTGVAHNYKEAVKWYRKASEQGNAIAQYKVGECYYYGEGVEKNYAEAVKWYRLAAEQGNADAQYEVGECYYYGKGVEENEEVAVKWYKKAANQGHEEAQDELDKLKEKKNEKELAKCYRNNAEQGDIEAQYKLGKCYHHGNGGLWNYEEAVKWYKKAAEQGHAEAQYELGHCYQYGEGVEENYEEAVKWYRLATEQGNAEAQNMLGRCYEEGQGVAQNYEEAVKWFRKAAEQGDAFSQYHLGKCYEEGKGVTQNYEEAVKWYKKSAEQGNKPAKDMLDRLEREKQWYERYYEQGNRYWRDGEYEGAFKCYRFAAEHGHAEARYKLGECYYYGKGVDENDKEAVEWYRLAAEQGNAKAQYQLGECYYSGNGVEKNYEEAVKWYRESAEQGNDVAQYKLGNCYYNGNGVLQDYTEAIKWYQKSAEQGGAFSQYKLGDCYQYGYGDYDEAVKWYRKAAENGYIPARYILQQIIDEKQLYKENEGTTQQQSTQSSPQSSKSGCFITTAVCLASGKADDCYELTMFRRFRDGYLARQCDGKALIAEYYRIAPSIVAKIDALSDAKAIYRAIRDTYLERCLYLIEQGRMAECKSLYIKMVRELASRYGVE